MSGRTEVKTRRILCVGLVCVDTVLVCQSYPVEDSDQRCLLKIMQLGGNAANSSTVLSKLGAECEFLGILTETCTHSQFVKTHFESNGIHYKNSAYHNNCKYPTSVIIVNNENGSRTILHHRDEWPDVTVEDFRKLDLSKYSWIHFQGRNTQEVIKMVSLIEQWNSLHKEEIQITISVELEKPRASNFDLYSSGDVVFIGKDFAQFVGCQNMHDAVEFVSKKVKPSATIIVPWGEQGAAAYSRETGIVDTRAFPPENVIDTLGAGDTFIAAVIHSLNNGEPLQKSIIRGCQIAGAKVGMYGYDNIGKFYASLTSECSH